MPDTWKVTLLNSLGRERVKALLDRVHVIWSTAVLAFYFWFVCFPVASFVSAALFVR